MQNRPELYVPFIYLLAAIPFVWLGLHAWRKRPAIAVTPFAWAMLGMAIWSFTYSLEIFFPSLPEKLLITKLEYIGIVSIPVFLFFFSLEFTGNSHLLVLRTRLLLWSIPLVILLLVWTNEYHHLMWDMATVIEMRGLKLLDIRYGPFFWVQIIFSYVLIIIASILLIMEMIQRPGIYRVQISLVVLSILTPWVGSLIFVGKVNPIPNLDITPLLFLPTGLGLSWAIIRYRLLEIVPLQHITLLKNMQDGVIVANASGRVLYINPLAEKLFNRSETEVIGQPLKHISEKYGELLASHLSGTETQAEIKMGMGALAKTYELTLSKISALNNQNSSDLMLSLHDITQRKEAEAALSRREAIMSAIGMAAEQFLKNSSWEQNIPEVLEKVGQAANVSRVYVFMNYFDEKGTIYTSRCYEWAAPGITAQIKNKKLQHIPLRAAGFKRWEDTLSSDEPIYGLLREFPESEQNALNGQDIHSLAILPIFVDSHWWGFIGFDECTYERNWTGTELESLHIAASILGSAETRARTEQKLIRRQEALNLLHDIVRQALQAKSLRLMAEKLSERLARLISANECFLTLWDEANLQVVPLASNSASRDTYLSLQPVSMDYTFTELALQSGNTLTVDDAYNSQYLEHEIAKQCPARSLIVLPLIAEKEKIGAIILSYKDFHHFQHDEITICEQASSLIALAFDKFRTMEQAQRRADNSETLRKAGAALSETLETGQAITRILEQLKEVIPYDGASVQILDGNELEIIGGRGWEHQTDFIGTRFPMNDNNPNSIVIKTSNAYLLSDAQKEFEVFRNPPYNKIKNWLGVPLIYQNKTIGIITIERFESTRFTPDEVHLAVTFANQASITLENARIFKETQDQAITDPLTGVYNRRGLFQIGDFEFERARRINRPFSAMIFDIDHFKKVNDQYGHATGDQTLRGMAERCRVSSRSVDVIGRYGGEEFVVLLPETNLESARMVAERLRMTIMKEPFATDGGDLPVTISIGVAETSQQDTLKTLIERADMALYEAKRAGRNCVVVNESTQLPDQI